jgi:hypothetical protein
MLTVVVSDDIQSLDLEEGHHSRTLTLGVSCIYLIGSASKVNSQNTGAHGHHGTYSFPLLNGDGPDNLPWKERKDDIHQA